MSEEWEIDYDDDMGGLDSFDDFDPESGEETGERSVAAKVSDAVLDSALSEDTAYTVGAAIKNNALPEGYSTTLDEIGDVVSNLDDVYEAGVKELKPAKTALQGAIRGQAENIKAWLPENIADTMLDFAGTERSREHIDPQEAAIAAANAAIFEQQSVTEAADTEYRDVRENTRDKMSASQHMENAGYLKIVAEGVSKLAGYQDSVLVNYQRKNLELQHRIYFATSDLLKVSKPYFDTAVELMKGIQKNTALPETVKYKMSERMDDFARDKMMGAVSDGISKYTSSFKKELWGDIKGKVVGAASAVKEGVISGIDMAGQLGEAAQDGGEDMAYGMAADTAVGAGVGFVTKKVSEKVRKLAEKNEKIMRLSKDLMYLNEGAAGGLQAWASSDKKFTETEVYRRAVISKMDLKEAAKRKIEDSVRKLIPATSEDRLKAHDDKIAEERKKRDTDYATVMGQLDAAAAPDEDARANEPGALYNNEGREVTLDSNGVEQAVERKGLAGALRSMAQGGMTDKEFAEDEWNPMRGAVDSIEQNGVTAAGLDVLAGFAKSVIPRFNESLDMGGSLMDNVSEAAKFDTITHRSVNVIIPGYLSRILGEFKILNTGDPTAEREVYSVEKEDFITVSEQDEVVKNHVFGEQEIRTKNEKSLEIAKTISNGELSEDAVNELSRAISASRDTKAAFVSDNYTSDGMYSTQSIATEVKTALNTMVTELDPERRLAVTQRFRQMRPSDNKLKNTAAMLHYTGNRESMKRLGILKEDANGKLVSDNETITSYRLGDHLADKNEDGTYGDAPDMGELIRARRLAADTAAGSPTPPPDVTESEQEVDAPPAVSDTDPGTQLPPPVGDDPEKPPVSDAEAPASANEGNDPLDQPPVVDAMPPTRGIMDTPSQVISEMSGETASDQADAVVDQLPPIVPPAPDELPISPIEPLYASGDDAEQQIAPETVVIINDPTVLAGGVPSNDVVQPHDSVDTASTDDLTTLSDINISVLQAVAGITATVDKQSTRMHDVVATGFADVIAILSAGGDNGPGGGGTPPSGSGGGNEWVKVREAVAPPQPIAWGDSRGGAWVPSADTDPHALSDTYGGENDWATIRRAYEFVNPPYNGSADDLVKGHQLTPQEPSYNPDADPHALSDTFGGDSDWAAIRGAHDFVTTPYNGGEDNWVKGHQPPPQEPAYTPDADPHALSDTYDGDITMSGFDHEGVYKGPPGGIIGSIGMVGYAGMLPAPIQDTPPVGGMLGFINGKVADVKGSSVYKSAEEKVAALDDRLSTNSTYVDAKTWVADHGGTLSDTISSINTDSVEKYYTDTKDSAEKVYAETKDSVEKSYSEAKEAVSSASTVKEALVNLSETDTVTNTKEAIKNTYESAKESVSTNVHVQDAVTSFNENEHVKSAKDAVDSAKATLEATLEDVTASDSSELGLAGKVLKGASETVSAVKGYAETPDGDQRGLFRRAADDASRFFGDKADTARDAAFVGPRAPQIPVDSFTGPLAPRDTGLAGDVITAAKAEIAASLDTGAAYVADIGSNEYGDTSVIQRADNLLDGLESSAKNAAVSLKNDFEESGIRGVVGIDKDSSYTAAIAKGVGKLGIKAGDGGDKPTGTLGKAVDKVEELELAIAAKVDALKVGDKLTTAADTAERVYADAKKDFMENSTVASVTKNVSGNEYYKKAVSAMTIGGDDTEVNNITSIMNSAKNLGASLTAQRDGPVITGPMMLDMSTLHGPTLPDAVKGRMETSRDNVVDVALNAKDMALDGVTTFFTGDPKDPEDLGFFNNLGASVDKALTTEGGEGDTDKSAVTKVGDKAAEVAGNTYKSAVNFISSAISGEQPAPTAEDAQAEESYLPAYGLALTALGENRTDLRSVSLTDKNTHLSEQISAMQSMETKTESDEELLRELAGMIVDSVDGNAKTSHALLQSVASATGEGRGGLLGMKDSFLESLRSGDGTAALLKNAYAGGLAGMTAAVVSKGLDVAGKVVTGGYMRITDVYVKGEMEPSILAKDMRAGTLRLVKNGKPIHRPTDIKGAVMNEDGEIILSDEEYRRGIQRRDGTPIRGGLNAAVRMVGRAWKAQFQAMGAAVKMGANLVGTVKRTLIVPDVYAKSDMRKPRLYAMGFRRGDYYSAVTGDNLRSPSDINGPVVDKNRVVLLTAEDLEGGVVDKDGRPVTRIERLIHGVGKTVRDAGGAVRRMYKTIRPDHDTGNRLDVINQTGDRSLWEILKQGEGTKSLRALISESVRSGASETTEEEARSVSLGRRGLRVDPTTGKVVPILPPAATTAAGAANAQPVAAEADPETPTTAATAASDVVGEMPAQADMATPAAPAATTAEVPETQTPAATTAAEAANASPTSPDPLGVEPPADTTAEVPETQTPAATTAEVPETQTPAATTAAEAANAQPVAAEDGPMPGGASAPPGQPDPDAAVEVETPTTAATAASDVVGEMPAQDGMATPAAPVPPGADLDTQSSEPTPRSAGLTQPDDATRPTDVGETVPLSTPAKEVVKQAVRAADAGATEEQIGEVLLEGAEALEASGDPSSKEILEAGVVLKERTFRTGAVFKGLFRLWGMQGRLISATAGLAATTAASVASGVRDGVRGGPSEIVPSAEVPTDGGSPTEQPAGELPDDVAAEDIDVSDDTTSDVNERGYFSAMLKQLRKIGKAVDPDDVAGDGDSDGKRDGSWQSRGGDPDTAASAVEGTPDGADEPATPDGPGKKKTWLEKAKGVKDNVTGVFDMMKNIRTVATTALSFGSTIASAATTMGTGIATLASGVTLAGAALVVGGVAVVAGLAYGTYLLYNHIVDNADVDPMEGLRFLQYGANPTDARFVSSIRRLESAVISEITWRGAYPMLKVKSDVFYKEHCEDFMRIIDSKADWEEWNLWFTQRFMVVLLKHLTVIHSLDDGVNLDDIDDEIEPEDRSTFVRRVQFGPEEAAAGLMPYNVLASPMRNHPVHGNAAAIGEYSNTLINHYDDIIAGNGDEDGGEFDPDLPAIPKGPVDNEVRIKANLEAERAMANPRNYFTDDTIAASKNKAVKAATLAAGLTLGGGTAVEYNRYDPMSVRGIPKSDFIMPANGRISSPFGFRIHPKYKVRKMHKGIDIAAPSGTPVMAVADGVIYRRYVSHRGYGNAIYIKHGDGTATRYAHMLRFADEYGKGDRVKQGAVIGYVGNTGIGTGSHLHFEHRKDAAQEATAIDPMLALTPTVRKEAVKQVRRDSKPLAKNDKEGADVNDLEGYGTLAGAPAIPPESDMPPAVREDIEESLPTDVALTPVKMAALFTETVSGVANASSVNRVKAKSHQEGGVISSTGVAPTPAVTPAAVPHSPTKTDVLRANAQRAVNGLKDITAELYSKVSPEDRLSLSLEELLAKTAEGVDAVLADKGANGTEQPIKLDTVNANRVKRGQPAITEVEFSSMSPSNALFATNAEVARSVISSETPLPVKVPPVVSPITPVTEQDEKLAKVNASRHNRGYGGITMGEYESITPSDALFATSDEVAAMTRLHEIDGASRSAAVNHYREASGLPSMPAKQVATLGTGEAIAHEEPVKQVTPAEAVAHKTDGDLLQINAKRAVSGLKDISMAVYATLSDEQAYVYKGDVGKSAWTDTYSPKVYSGSPTTQVATTPANKPAGAATQDVNTAIQLDMSSGFSHAPTPPLPNVGNYTAVMNAQLELGNKAHNQREKLISSQTLIASKLDGILARLDKRASEAPKPPKVEPTTTVNKTTVNNVMGSTGGTEREFNPVVKYKS